jgi:dihydroorotate dehydrogenase
VFVTFVDNVSTERYKHTESWEATGMTVFDTLYKSVALPPVRYFTRRDAEIAHNWFVNVMARASSRPGFVGRLGRPIAHPLLGQTLMDGVHFPNPFGTAAGMDKNATLYPALFALTGVGHVEVGGVTLQPQPGNERPRLVRVDARHLINAMGFPNDGVEAVVRRLSGSRRPAGPLGVQIAKNKATTDANAAGEYAMVVRAFANVPGRDPLPDYFTINVSSPNTPGLRNLQAPEMLESILKLVTTELDSQQRSRRRLLVKLAPDITTSLVDEVIELIEKYDTGGLVLTNTTTERLVHSRFDDRPGGFSGPTLYRLSSELVKHAASKLSMDRVLVACGGINSVERAFEMLQYADLVDAYTSLVLESPRQFHTFAPQIVAGMEAAGVSSLEELRRPNRAPASSHLQWHK